MRVMLSLEIKLTELPEPEGAPDEAPMIVGDPMEALGKMAGRMMNIGSPSAIFPMPRMPGGLDFRRSAVLGCGSFPTLVDILNAYNELTTKLENNWP